MHRTQASSHQPSPKPRLQHRQRTECGYDGQSLTTSLDGDEDVDSQDFSDSSSDAEGVFAFNPPTTAEQRIILRQLSTSPNYNSSPPSEDVHTLVESPMPLAAALAGPSRLTSQAHFDPSIEPYRFPRQNGVAPSYPDLDRCNPSRPSSRASHHKTKSDVRIAFAETVIIKERSEKSDVVAEAAESILGFEFDDTESRDGSKEYVPTFSAKSFLVDIVADVT